jgi:hypothetical protein
MTAPSLSAALRVGAEGPYTLQAATGLLIAHGTGSPATTSPLHPPRHRDSGDRLGSRDHRARCGRTSQLGGERRMLKITASLAGGIPVDLRDTLTGLDDRNVQLLSTAVLHASGQSRSPRRP